MGAWGYLLKGSSERRAAAGGGGGGADRRYLGPQAAEFAASVPHRRGRAAGGADALSPRERQILLMVARGAASTAIGSRCTCRRRRWTPTAAG